MNLEQLSECKDRHKLFLLPTVPSELLELVSSLKKLGIPPINIGLQLSACINGLADHSFIHIDVFEHFQRLLESHKSKVNNRGNDIVAIYNIGILLEPALGLNAAQLLKEFSKTAALIIIWENQSDTPDRLHWSTQQNNVFLDFTETPLKKLTYAI
jgi:hypothetical protein